MSFQVNPPTIPSQGKARILVLTCIDPRFTELLAWFLTHVKEVHQDYDLFALAGSSLAVVQADWDPLTEAPLEVQTNNPTLTILPHWKLTFYDHASLALALHNIEEIWVFEHMGCGAYKQFFGIPNDNDTQRHIDMFNDFKQSVMDNGAGGVENLKVQGFIMFLNGKIEKIAGNDAKISLEPFNKLKGYWYGLGTAVFIFLFISYLANTIRKR